MAKKTTKAAKHDFRTGKAFAAWNRAGQQDGIKGLAYRIARLNVGVKADYSKMAKALIVD